ncbi:MAG: hypothetical protein ACRC33_14815, partial [Gemmataceae bacterium]
TVGGGGGEGGSGAIQSGAPNMIGDLGASRFFGRQISGVGGGGFRVAENESPRPQDRVFLTYNYFDQVGGKFATGPGFESRFNLHRGVVGFEKTVLEGNASVGLRVPVLYIDSNQGQSVTGVGNVSLVTKYAFLNDTETGSVVSGGLIVSSPSLSDKVAIGVDAESWLLQPYLGAILVSDRFFVQGFTAITVPTADKDTTFLGNDVGVGYRIYENYGGESLLTSITPTVELHLITPLNNRGLAPLLRGERDNGQPDMLSLTGGFHFGLGERTFLTIAGNVPLTGPNLYNFEGVLQLNVGF